MGNIIALVEQRNGELKKSAFEVVTAAGRVAKDLGVGMTAVVFSEKPIDSAGQLGRFGAAEVLSISGDAFKGYAPATFARAVAELAEKNGSPAVFLAASATGKDLAPRIAALLGVPQASDCIGVAVKDGELQALRPIYAGKVLCTVRSRQKRMLVTLRPNVVTPEETGGEAVAVNAHVPAQVAAPKVTLKEVVEPQGGKTLDVTEADVVVAGGRGMKGPEHYALLEKLAAVLGAAIGSSRAVVDAGWRPHSEQVGQTGKTVSPNLYIACGISGAIQHLAGMSSSRVIVAVNKDKEAPIFKVADYGIVGDLFEVVPVLTEELKKVKAGSE